MAIAVQEASGINRMTAMILGWILVAVGLLGYVWDPVLFVFDVGPVHNIVHLLTGAILLAGAYMNDGLYARPVNITLGIVYIVVMLMGFFTPELLLAIMDFNAADNWLHLALGLVLVGVGFAGRTTETRPTVGTVR